MERRGNVTMLRRRMPYIYNWVILIGGVYTVLFDSKIKKKVRLSRYENNTIILTCNRLQLS